MGIYKTNRPNESKNIFDSQGYSFQEEEPAPDKPVEIKTMSTPYIKIASKEERCDFCEDRLPMSTKFHAMWIGKSAFGRCLMIKNTSICPPYADCCNKEYMERYISDMKIKFCPLCGRKIEDTN